MNNIAGLFISPVIFFSLFLYLKLKFPKESTELLIKSFLWGCIISIPVILADLAAHYLILDGARSIRRMIVYSFIVVAFVTEVSKFLPIRFSLTNKARLKGPPEGIIYTIMVALGLSTLYAIYYLFFSARSGADPAYFLSIGPMNVVLAIIMGFFIGLGKLRKNLFIDSMTGLGATILFHGIYRFVLLSRDITLFWLFAAGTVFIASILIYKSKRMQKELD